MEYETDILKGIHPGFILSQKLKERKLSKGRFALSINEYPQTLGAITKGRRRMNTALAMKIEEELGLSEGYFMTLQVFYDIKQEKQRQRASYRPDLSKLRPALFWDTDINHIDWKQKKRAVIQRVFERGNDAEKAEIIRFYGEKAVNEVIK